MIAENVKLAFSSMVQNKMRTLLSLMGIVIGVASVVAILNLGQSVTDTMLESMAAGGLDMLTITAAIFTGITLKIVCSSFERNRLLWHLTFKG